MHLNWTSTDDVLEWKCMGWQHLVNFKSVNEEKHCLLGIPSSMNVISFCSLKNLWVVWSVSVLAGKGCNLAGMG